MTKPREHGLPEKPLECALCGAEPMYEKTQVVEPSLEFYRHPLGKCPIKGAHLLINWNALQSAISARVEEAETRANEAEEAIDSVLADLTQAVEGEDERTASAVSEAVEPLVRVAIHLDDLIKRTTGTGLPWVDEILDPYRTPGEPTDLQGGAWPGVGESWHDSTGEVEVVELKRRAHSVIYQREGYTAHIRIHILHWREQFSPGEPEKEASMSNHHYEYPGGVFEGPKPSPKPLDLDAIGRQYITQGRISPTNAEELLDHCRALEAERDEQRAELAALKERVETLEQWERIGHRVQETIPHLMRVPMFKEPFKSFLGGRFEMIRKDIDALSSRPTPGGQDE